MRHAWQWVGFFAFAYLLYAGPGFVLSWLLWWSIEVMPPEARSVLHIQRMHEPTLGQMARLAVVSASFLTLLLFISYRRAQAKQRRADAETLEVFE